MTSISFESEYIVDDSEILRLLMIFITMKMSELDQLRLNFFNYSIIFQCAQLRFCISWLLYHQENKSLARVDYESPRFLFRTLEHL